VLNNATAEVLKEIDMTLAARLTNVLRGRRDADNTERQVVKTDDEWRQQLTPQQYRVLRRAGTESPFSAETVSPDASGVYRCAACAAALFRADTKFDSGTGWPSFADAEPGAVDLRRDFSMGLPRTEVVCHSCGGHLGHVVGDGPGPTGQRYCINGCALGSGTSHEG